MYWRSQRRRFRARFIFRLSALGIYQLLTPAGRSRVHKNLCTEFDEDAIKVAIEKEMERKGQIFFVHGPRTLDLFNCPSGWASCATGEGWCRSRSNEVCGNWKSNGQICPAGMRCPCLYNYHRVRFGYSNANTIIINRAEKFGLAQLYQIRGRVGRSSVKLSLTFYCEGSDAFPRSHEKTTVIKEFSEPGSGFRIA